MYNWFHRLNYEQKYKFIQIKAGDNWETGVLIPSGILNTTLEEKEK